MKNIVLVLILFSCCVVVTAQENPGNLPFPSTQVAREEDIAPEDGNEDSEEVPPTTPTFVSGSAEILITEISPHKIGDEEEWFEFIFSSQEAVDITDWTISNGRTTKTFGEKTHQLIWPDGLNNLSGQTVLIDTDGKVRAQPINPETAVEITLPEDRIIVLPETDEAIFTWTKSPVSLTNGGATISIASESSELQDEITYPETRAGTFQSHPYAEVWNRDGDELFPLLHRTHPGSRFQHTKGRPNHARPTQSEAMQLLISEASPDRDADFLELEVQNTSHDRANLKMMKLKHNGTELIEIDHDFWVETGDFILVEFGDQEPRVVSSTNPHRISTNSLSGLSAGSGTVEIILNSGTSFEAREDVVCWQSGNLSQTEVNRVNGFIEDGDWVGACVEIENLITNESMARPPGGPDTNSAADFFRHFNGSEGGENIKNNHEPNAKIIVQGGQKIFRSALNFTGFDGVEASTDPDGQHDLKSFEWRVNGKTCPDDPELDGWNWRKECTEEFVRPNPDKIDFLNLGTYTVSLKVTDFSGATDTDEVEIEVTENGIDPFGIGTGGSSDAFETSFGKWFVKELEKVEKNAAKDVPGRGVNEDVQDFFTDFVEKTDISNLHEAALLNVPTEELEIPPRPLFQKDNFPDHCRPYLAKNIGLTLLEPEWLATGPASISDPKDHSETRQLVYFLQWPDDWP